MNSTNSPIAAYPSLADVQSLADARRIPIQKAGVKDVLVPVKVSGRSGRTQHTVARFAMTVNLAHEQKGVHMSRFVELLNSFEHELAYTTFCDLLVLMVGRLETDAGDIELSFPYFVKKTGPVSRAQSLMDYQVTLVGKLKEGKPKVTVRVVVPATSLCPCSREISAYGAHNQRSHVTIAAVTDGRLWIDDLIQVAEDEASCEVYALLKRADEKYVTERAYDNPKFVEDTVRDLAARLVQDERVSTFTVECENFESIHNHSAYAMIHGEAQPGQA